MENTPEKKTTETLRFFTGIIPDLFFEGLAVNKKEARAQIREQLIKQFDNDDLGLIIDVWLNHKSKCSASQRLRK